MELERPKIMIVDDDPGMRLTLGGIIEEEGFDVSLAADGREAIELAEQNTFLLIFMDIKMPGIHGVDAYREIKKLSPGTVVVMMTGFSMPELINEALNEGAHSVVYKPFEVGQIIKLINDVLGSAVVLVVDGQAADSKSLKSALEASGFKVGEAGGGAEAVGLVGQRNCGVILVEADGNSRDGLATCEEIMRTDPLVKVIFIGKSCGKDDNDPFTTPVKPDEVLDLVRSITTALA